MKYKLDKGTHSVYALQYHFFRCVKYRKGVLTKFDVVIILKNKIREIARRLTLSAQHLNCMRHG